MFTTVMVFRQKMMETLQDSFPFTPMSILFLLVSVKIREIDNSSVLHSRPKFNNSLQVTSSSRNLMPVFSALHWV